MGTVKNTINPACKKEIEYYLKQINFAKKKTIYPSGQKM